MCETSAVTQFVVDPHSKPSIYAFYKQFHGTDCLCKGDVASAAKGTDGSEIIQFNSIQFNSILVVYRFTNRAHIKQPQVVSCSLMSEISEIVKITCAHPVYVCVCNDDL
jgi:hypothetical protein